LISLFKKVLFVSLLIFVVIGESTGSEIKVVYSNDPGRSEILRTIEKDNNSFVSGIEIARLLEARTFYSAEKKKMDIKFKEWRVKLSAYSSFVLMENIGEDRNGDDILHFPVPTLSSDNDILIPIIPLMDILDKIMNEKRSAITKN